MLTAPCKCFLGNLYQLFLCPQNSNFLSFFRYAESVGAKHYHTSAKLNKGIEELFLDLCKRTLFLDAVYTVSLSVFHNTTGFMINRNCVFQSITWHCSFTHKQLIMFSVVLSNDYFASKISCCLHNMCVYCVYLLCIYKHTHTVFI